MMIALPNLNKTCLRALLSSVRNNSDRSVRTEPAEATELFFRMIALPNLNKTCLLALLSSVRNNSDRSDRTESAEATEFLL